MRTRRESAGFFLLLSVLAAAVFLGGGFAMRSRMDADAKRLAEVRQQQQALIDEIGDLERRIQFAQTDAFVENAARSEGYLRPGDIRYMSGGK